MYNANEMGPSQCLHIVSNIWNKENELVYTHETKISKMLLQKFSSILHLK